MPRGDLFNQGSNIPYNRKVYQVCDTEYVNLSTAGYLWFRLFCWRHPGYNVVLCETRDEGAENHKYQYKVCDYRGAIIEAKKVD